MQKPPLRGIKGRLHRTRGLRWRWAVPLTPKDPGRHVRAIRSEIRALEASLPEPHEADGWLLSLLKQVRHPVQNLGGRASGLTSSDCISSAVHQVEPDQLKGAAMLLPENHFREAQSRLSREFWFHGLATAAPGGLRFTLAASPRTVPTRSFRRVLVPGWPWDCQPRWGFVRGRSWAGRFRCEKTVDARSAPCRTRGLSVLWRVGRRDLDAGSGYVRGGKLGCRFLAPSVDLRRVLLRPKTLSSALTTHLLGVELGPDLKFMHQRIFQEQQVFFHAFSFDKERRKSSLVHTVFQKKGHEKSKKDILSE